jgi:hypothetical protein
MKVYVVHSSCRLCIEMSENNETNHTTYPCLPYVFGNDAFFSTWSCSCVSLLRPCLTKRQCMLCDDHVDTVSYCKHITSSEQKYNHQIHHEIYIDYDGYSRKIQTKTQRYHISRPDPYTLIRIRQNTLSHQPLSHHKHSYSSSSSNTIFLLILSTTLQ